MSKSGVDMITEPKIIDPKVFYDNRGYFYESFYKKIEEEVGCRFVQDNESFSNKNVVRGLHYQWDNPMGKLVRCAYGNINDIIVDIRQSSKNYGKVHYFSLNDTNKKLLWVPPGFAHGFEVLSVHALVMYKCTSYYNKSGESGINPIDKDLDIQWNIPSDFMIMSSKDLFSKSFADYSNDPRFN